MKDQHLQNATVKLPYFPLENGWDRGSMEIVLLYSEYAAEMERAVVDLGHLVELGLQVHYFQRILPHPVAAFDAGASCGVVASASFPCLDSWDPSKI